MNPCPSRHRLRFLLCLALAAAPLWAQKWQSPVFPAAEGVVKNPHSGLTFMPYRATREQAEKYSPWLLDAASIAYFRIPWTDVVDERGEYRFDRLDREWFSSYAKKGLRLAFRIMPASRTSSDPCLFPRETLGKNIPFLKKTLFLNPGAGNASQIREQWIPIYWNPEYVREHGRLMQALGAFVDAHPEVDFVDLGGMGEYGEVHLGSWDENELAQYGYSDARYVEAIITMMEQMERALPRTPKAICVSPWPRPECLPSYRIVIDRAVRMGWWLRNDGFSEKGLPPKAAPIFEKYRGLAPVSLEPNGAINNTFGDPIRISDYFAAAVAARASVANLMVGNSLERLSDGDKAQVTEASHRIGYRLQVAKASFPTEATVYGGRASLPLAVTVAQNGSSPFFGAAFYEWRFEQEGRVVHTASLNPDAPWRELLPQQARRDRYYLRLPLAPKRTRVSLGIRDSSFGLLRLDNRGTDASGFLPLGELDLREEKGAKAEGSDLLPMLEAGVRAEGVQFARTGEGVTLSGLSSKGWAYGSFTGALALNPDSVYLMRVSLKAMKGAIPGNRIKICLHVRKPGEAEATRYYTPYYDFDREGQWQDLEIAYQPRQKEEAVNFVMEKGRSAASSIQGEIRSWRLIEIALPPAE